MTREVKQFDKRSRHIKFDSIRIKFVQNKLLASIDLTNFFAMDFES